MSRLARSNPDGHQLLELRARFRVLLADTEGIYDPADHNDRLMLGLLKPTAFQTCLTSPTKVPSGNLGRIGKMRDIDYNYLWPRRPSKN